MKLADGLNQASFIEKMKDYLREKDYDVLPDSFYPDICPLDVFQAMIQTCLISESDLSKLKDMMAFCLRNDLIKCIDEFINKRGAYKKGKLRKRLFT